MEFIWRSKTIVSATVGPWDTSVVVAHSAGVIQAINYVTKKVTALRHLTPPPFKIVACNIPVAQSSTVNSAYLVFFGGGFRLLDNRLEDIAAATTQMLPLCGALFSAGSSVGVAVGCSDGTVVSTSNVLTPRRHVFSTIKLPEAIVDIQPAVSASGSAVICILGETQIFQVAVVQGEMCSEYSSMRMSVPTSITHGMLLASGRAICAGSPDDETVTLINCQTGALLSTLRSEDGDLQDIAVSADRSWCCFLTRMNAVARIEGIELNSLKAVSDFAIQLNEDGAPIAAGDIEIQPLTFCDKECLAVISRSAIQFVSFGELSEATSPQAAASPSSDEQQPAELTTVVSTDVTIDDDDDETKSCFLLREGKELRIKVHEPFKHLQHSHEPMPTSVSAASETVKQDSIIDVTTDSRDLEECRNQMHVFVSTKLVGDGADEHLFVPIGVNADAQSVRRHLESLFDRRLSVCFVTPGGRLVELRPSTVHLFHSILDEDKKFHCRPLYPMISKEKSRQVTTQLTTTRSMLLSAPLSRPVTSGAFTAEESLLRSLRPATVIDRRGEKAMLERLHDNSQVETSHRREELEKKHHPTFTPQKIGPKDTNAMLRRLTTGSQRKAAQIREKLRKDYEREGYIPSLGQRIDPEETQEIIQHFYYERLKREHAREEMLEKKRFTPPPYKKISAKADWEAWFQRMQQPIKKEFRLKGLY